MILLDALMFTAWLLFITILLIFTAILVLVLRGMNK